MTYKLLLVQLLLIPLLSEVKGQCKESFGFVDDNYSSVKNHYDSLYVYHIDNHKYFSSYTFTELGYHCYKGNFERVKELVEDGADIEQGMSNDYFVYGAIHPAIISENIKIIEYLLDKGSEIEAISSESGITPITTATEIKNSKKSYQITKLLLDYGANPNGGGRLGFNNIITIYPIIEAIKNGNVETVKLLIESEADIILDGESENLIFDAVIDIENEDIVVKIASLLLKTNTFNNKNNLIELSKKSERKGKKRLTELIDSYITTL